MKISKTCLFWFWLYLIMINFQVFDTVKLAFCYLGSVYFIYPFESRMPWGYYWIYVIICVCPKYSSIMPQIGSRRIQGNSRSMDIMIHFFLWNVFSYLNKYFYYTGWLFIEMTLIDITWSSQELLTFLTGVDILKLSLFFFSLWWGNLNTQS